MGTDVQVMGEANDRMVGAADVFGDSRSDWTDDFEDEVRDIFGEEANRRSKDARASAVPALAEWILTTESQIAKGNEYLTREDTVKAPTGFANIDGAIDMGIRPGEVFGLMARPGVGKTITICNLAKTWGIVCPGRVHVFFSLEQPGPQVVLRNRQLAYGMTKREIRDATMAGTLDHEVYRQMFQHFVIVDRPGLSLDDMANVLKKVQQALQLPIGMVSIDYLGLIGGNKGMSRYERVSQNAVDCKTLARNFNAAVFLAIQVSREGGGDGSKPIALGAARDSGVIEEACDYMAGLWRSGEQLAMALLKNRHGPLVDMFSVFFDKSTLELRDYV
jgi:replicative DNA helicase